MTFCSYHLIQTETPGFPRSSNSSTKAAVIWGGFMQRQLVSSGHNVQGFTQQQPPTMTTEWFPFIVNVLPQVAAVNTWSYQDTMHQMNTITNQFLIIEKKSPLHCSLNYHLHSPLTVRLQYHSNYLQVFALQHSYWTLTQSYPEPTSCVMVAGSNWVWSWSITVIQKQYTSLEESGFCWLCINSS